MFNVQSSDECVTHGLRYCLY